MLRNFKLARTDYKSYKNNIVVTKVDSECQTIERYPLKKHA